MITQVALPIDHGMLSSGAWRNKSENPDPADHAPRLIIEWTANL
jgi:hypothetical protein